MDGRVATRAGDGAPPARPHDRALEKDLEQLAARVIGGSQEYDELEFGWLDLSLGVLLDRGAALLEKHARAFAHLEVLDVTDTGLGRFDELKALIPGLHRGPEWGRRLIGTFR